MKDNVRPRRFSKGRILFFRSVEWICRILGGRHCYRFFYLRSSRLGIREEVIHIKNLPRELDGFTIIQLTDFHGGSFLHARDLDGVVDVTNRMNANVVALTGDFLTHVTEEALELAPALGRLRARNGVFAVFGNHDYRGRREGEIEREFTKAGIKTLRNENCSVAPRMVVAGVEDLEEGKFPDFTKALSGIAAGATVVLLCHHPAGVEFVHDRGVSLVLSGHTHGTQIRWPFLKNLGPAHPGDRMKSGDTELIVSHGIGVIGVPLRIGTKAEIVVVKLIKESGSGGSLENTN